MKQPSFSASCKCFLTTCLLGLAASINLSFTTFAETPTFYIQETIRDLRPYQPEPSSGNAQLDQTASEAHQFSLQESILQNIQSQTGIIGLDMQIQEGRYPLVKQVFKGTPAQQKGILPGDAIIAVNGTRTLGKTYNEIDYLISNIPGEEVDFTISRANQLQVIRLTVMALTTNSGNLTTIYSDMFPKR